MIIFLTFLKIKVLLNLISSFPLIKKSEIILCLSCIWLTHSQVSLKRCSSIFFVGNTNEIMAHWIFDIRFLKLIIFSKHDDSTYSISKQDVFL